MNAPRFYPGSALVIVAAWPDRRIDAGLIYWLAHNGFNIAGNVRETCWRDVSVAYNRAVAEYALGWHGGWVLFADNDIRPGPQAPGAPDPTAPFLDPTIDAEIVGCLYPTAPACSWARPDRIHTGLYRVRTDALRAMHDAAGGRALYRREYSADGRQIVGCECSYFCDQAIAAGLRIARAGWADHPITREDGR